MSRRHTSAPKFHCISKCIDKHNWTWIIMLTSANISKVRFKTIGFLRSSHTVLPNMETSFTTVVRTNNYSRRLKPLKDPNFSVTCQTSLYLACCLKFRCLVPFTPNRWFVMSSHTQFPNWEVSEVYPHLKLSMQGICTEVIQIKITLWKTLPCPTPLSLSLVA